MNIPQTVFSASIVFAGLLIAMAIFSVFRWQVAPTRDGAVRLDRWSGAIVECRYDVYKIGNEPLGPRDLNCTSQ